MDHYQVKFRGKNGQTHYGVDDRGAGLASAGPAETLGRAQSVKGSRMCHADKCNAFQAILREWAIPHIVVEESRKALFGQAKLETFDFIVYAEQGPNLLIDLRNPTLKLCDGLRQWQEVFGDGFRACFCRLGPGDPELTDLDGSPIAADVLRSAPVLSTSAPSRR